MAELISSIGIVQIALVLIIAIPAIINFIKWCKGVWGEREKFKQDNINKGRQIEAKEEKEEHRFESGESRIANLETEVADLKKLVALLVESDLLDIKSWIKMQHEKWIPRGCIDSQTLDLLEQRFSVYEREGGNHWAKKLVEELRALPVVTVVQVTDVHSQQQ